MHDYEIACAACGCLGFDSSREDAERIARVHALICRPAGTVTVTREHVLTGDRRVVATTGLDLALKTLDQEVR